MLVTPTAGRGAARGGHRLRAGPAQRAATDARGVTLDRRRRRACRHAGLHGARAGRRRRRSRRRRRLRARRGALRDGDRPAAVRRRTPRSPRRFKRLQRGAAAADVRTCPTSIRAGKRRSCAASHAARRIVSHRPPMSSPTLKHRIAHSRAGAGKRLPPRSLRSRRSLWPLRSLRLCTRAFTSRRRSPTRTRSSWPTSSIRRATRSFDDTLKKAPAIQLEQSPFLRVLSDRAVNTTLKLMNRPPTEPLTEAVTR